MKLYFYIISIIVIGICSSSLSAQQAYPAAYDSIAQKIATTALMENRAYGMLADLCTNVGARIAGSPQAAKAVAWATKKMQDLGFQNVHTEPVMVPHWIRGHEEGSYSVDRKKKVSLHLCALGGSIGTSKNGIRAEVVQIKSWEELKAQGEHVKGKIVFFNRPMDRSIYHTGTAYGLAVDQRGHGATEAARYGAVAVLVRSMSTRLDNVPHTGQMVYDSTVTKIPAAAISTNDADVLDKEISQKKSVVVSLNLGCRMLPDVESANVIGEITGSELPREVLLVGAHLDSWDKGQGAQDDGAGVAHTLEMLRLMKELNLHPKRTIRVVLFMNEENGLSGGFAYANMRRPQEKLIGAIETDNGGFSPRGFGVTDTIVLSRLIRFAPLLNSIGADKIVRGHSGSDLYPLELQHVPTIGLQVDMQRYFDYHHSDSDVLATVNERELALGAAALAILSYAIAQEGI
ncbi:MAG TPA: M20/M25/M40 family metallo-hydrolase [Bacteroidota bacterium]|nr:M20/M25/M40 family metallo-hydrolase [Bacteroidota bacterium]